MMCPAFTTPRTAAVRRTCALGAIAALFAAIGCESASTSTTTGPGRGAPPAPTTAAASTSNAPPSDDKSPPDAGQPKSSSIAGDRVKSFAPIIMSKQTVPSPFRFTDVAQQSGLKFVHFSGMTVDKYFPTANGSGTAVFDYDNDGLLDIYFATATLLPLGKAEELRKNLAHDLHADETRALLDRIGPNRLFKNLGDGRFQDVSKSSHLNYRGFCHGVIVGDIDNDGDQDVFLCNYGPNALYLNNGDGTFSDISKQAGIDAPNWSSGGAMLDYDNDGLLDIYVTNYGIWKYPDDHQRVGDPKKKVWLYASPRTIRTTKHLFYHNNGDRTFTNVLDRVITAESETGAKTKARVPKPRDDGHGFGVVAADINNDGLIDLYIANDMNPNFLFLNRGDGTFDDATDLSGAAYDINGQAQSGMGVDVEDVDGDGLPEIFVTNFANEYNTLYQNHGRGVFFDSTPFFGLASDSMPWVGWGCSLSDFDNDGWPDCFVANGHVDNNRHELDQPVDYEEPPLLFHNEHGKRFRLATREAGAYFDEKHVARGAAFGDIDNDGDIDIVINHKDGAPALLRNDTPSKNHWARFVLQGTRSNRDAIGAKLEITAGGRTIHRQRKSGYSLQGTNDPRVLVGIGTAQKIDKLVVRWPSRAKTTLEELEIDREYKLVEPREGDGAPPAPKEEPAADKGEAKAKAKPRAKAKVKDQEKVGAAPAPAQPQTKGSAPAETGGPA